MESLTPPPPRTSFSTPASPATTLRLKWDNLAIVFAGALVAACVAAWIMFGGGAQSQAARTSTPKLDTTSGLEVAAPADSETLTLDEARDLVTQARDYMGQARWSEAADRLDAVPAQFALAVGATTLRTKLEQSRSRWVALSSALTTQVAGGDWTKAAATLDELATIARLDDAMLAIRARVQAALGGGSSAPPAATKPTRGGGSNRTGGHGGHRPGAGSHTRPGTSGGGSHRHPGGGSRPGVTGGGGTSANTDTSTSNSVSSILGDADLDLDSDTQAQLEAILGSGAIDARSIARIKAALGGVLSSSQMNDLLAAVRDAAGSAASSDASSSSDTGDLAGLLGQLTG